MVMIVPLGVTFSFGLIGWVDDYRKVVQKNPRGLPAKWKYFWQSVLGLTVAVALFSTATVPADTTLYLPFLKNVLGFGFQQSGFGLHLNYSWAHLIR